MKLSSTVTFSLMMKPGSITTKSLNRLNILLYNLTIPTLHRHRTHGINSFHESFYRAGDQYPHTKIPTQVLSVSNILILQLF